MTPEQILELASNYLFKIGRDEYRIYKNDILAFAHAIQSSGGEPTTLYDDFVFMDKVLNEKIIGYWHEGQNRLWRKDSASPQAIKEYNLKPLYLAQPDQSARIAELTKDNQKLREALELIQSSEINFSGRCNNGLTTFDVAKKALAVKDK